MGFTSLKILRVFSQILSKICYFWCFFVGLLSFMPLKVNKVAKKGKADQSDLSCCLSTSSGSFKWTQDLLAYQLHVVFSISCAYFSSIFKFSKKSSDKEFPELSSRLSPSSKGSLIGTQPKTGFLGVSSKVSKSPISGDSRVSTFDFSFSLFSSN